MWWLACHTPEETQCPSCYEVTRGVSPEVALLGLALLARPALCPGVGVGAVAAAHGVPTHHTARCPT